MRVAGFIGESGSGKTTLIVALIREYRARGLAVAVVKHTHHTVDSKENRGDTLQFLEAGAQSATLALNGGTALTWRPSVNDPDETVWSQVDELVRDLPADVVLVEGFHCAGEWPRVSVGLSHAGLARVVALAADDEHDAGPLPLFRRDAVQELADFLDTIALS